VPHAAPYAASEHALHAALFVPSARFMICARKDCAIAANSRTPTICFAQATRYARTPPAQRRHYFYLCRHSSRQCANSVMIIDRYSLQRSGAKQARCASRYRAAVNHDAATPAPPSLPDYGTRDCLLITSHAHATLIDDAPLPALFLPIALLRHAMPRLFAFHAFATICAMLCRRCRHAINHVHASLLRYRCFDYLSIDVYMPRRFTACRAPRMPIRRRRDAAADAARRV